jgi:hypothetical protein
MTAMTLIETKTLGTAAASIEFTSIPQDGTDLLAVASLRLDVDSLVVNIRFNGDTGSNFSGVRLIGSGSAATSTSYTDSSFETIAQGFSTATANTFANMSVYIPNYSGSTAKSVSIDEVSEDNATFSRQVIHAGLWTGTSGITSILFSRLAGGNLVAGSTISLYKITKGSDGIVTTS